MKREELEALGLEKDMIDTIMGIHGKDIQGLKDDIQSRDSTIQSYKEQLDTANKDIDKFKKENKDIESVQKLADDWKSKFENAENARVQTVNNARLDKALAGFKARDVDVVKKLIDSEKLSFKDDDIIGLNEQIEALKKSNDYLFAAENDNGGTGDGYRPYIPDNGSGNAKSQIESDIDKIMNL